MREGNEESSRKNFVQNEEDEVKHTKKSAVFFKKSVNIGIRVRLYYAYRLRGEVKEGSHFFLFLAGLLSSQPLAFIVKILCLPYNLMYFPSLAHC